MNLTAIDMIDFHATSTEFEKGGYIDMAINIASLRDWIVYLMKKFRLFLKYNSLIDYPLNEINFNWNNVSDFIY